jgi:predicted HicB family RNase H-like nuclease
LVNVLNHARIVGLLRKLHRGAIPCGLAFGETSVAKKKATLPKSVTLAAPRPKKATATGRTSDRFQLRLPEGMRDKLVEAANGRSLNDEIIERLTQSLERDEMQKLSDRLKAQGDRLAKFEGEIASMVEQLRLRDD